MGRTLTRIAHEIVERNRGTSTGPGRHPHARRRARQAPRQVLEQITSDPVRTGALDITLYRDDVMRHTSGPQPIVRRTEIPFSIDDQKILLVDDVLYTGRRFARPSTR
jgi:pyrimidine operon attenuation protein/uracil phosphoribosyltransferase